MKLIITADKTLHFRAIGSVEPQHWKNRQEEKLVIEIRDDNDALVAIDSGTLKVKLKATKESEDILAQCTSFTVAANIHTGWIDLNTDECNALANSQVFIEVSWKVSGHEQATDDATVWIIARVVTGDEGDPETTSALVTAEWLTAHILVSGALTLTADTDAGTVTIAPVIASQISAEIGSGSGLMTPERTAQAIAALGGSSDAPSYAAGFLTFTASDGHQYEVAAVPVA